MRLSKPYPHDYRRPEDAEGTRAPTSPVFNIEQLEELLNDDAALFIPSHREFIIAHLIYIDHIL